MTITRRAAVQMLAATSAAALAGPAIGRIGSRTPPWDRLRERVVDRLIRVRSPLAECARAGGAGADALFKSLRNPYLLGDEPGLTQTLGWTDAWTSRASDYTVAAESAADVAAAIDFAREHGVRLVVKGGGHSYFGNSNAADSLLIWTRPMQKVELHDSFRPAGAPAGHAAIPAVSIGAGAIWGRVYEQVAAKGGRLVLGGGCLTVGVAGFVLGGGFGSLSKAYGTGASNLLEAEVVTADGRVRVANAHRHPALFFALKGGGGGTFGVVTRLTLRTDPLPSTIGAVQLGLTARDEPAWRRLVERMMRFYAEALFNPTWGEQIRFSPGRRLSVTMVFHGLNEPAARAVWCPFLDWVAAHPEDYARSGEPLVIAVPGRRFWDSAFLRSIPEIVLADDRRGAPETNIFWASNLGEAAQVLHAYQSAWLPAALLAPEQRTELVGALIEAAAEWSITLHTNKGLAGGSPEAIARARATATNPEVVDAFALLICAAEGPPAWPGIPGFQPDVAEGRRDAAGVTRAMAPIRRLVPQAGAYMSEADYHGSEWQRAYWGRHYPTLLAAKRRYDPVALLSGHHTVGSA